MREQTRGSVLISVLWILAMLTIFSVVVNHQASAQIVLGRWLMDRVLARELALAGVERALYEIQSDKFLTFDAVSEPWANAPDAFEGNSLGEGSFFVVCGEESESGPQVRYGACDESSRINLNTAPDWVLKNLLQIVAKDITAEKAEEISWAIIDWRDEDDAVSAHGAEASDYKAQSTPYEPRNGKFQSVEELLLVRGMTRKIFDLLLPWVTVYTQGRVNFNTASSTVLQALGLSESLAEKVVEFRCGGDGKSGTKDDEVFQYSDGITPALSVGSSFSAEDFEQIANAVSAGVVGVQSDAFRIQAIGRLIKGSTPFQEGITAVVKRNGTILYWKEGVPDISGFS